MKKILIFSLVALIPFMSFSQKRSKNKTESFENYNHEFMIITVYTSSATSSAIVNVAGERPKNRVKVSFDFGGEKIDEDLMERKYKSPAHAINEASKKGWEFINSSVILIGQNQTHYYYMKRKK